jgi:hypothetical protein
LVSNSSPKFCAEDHPSAPRLPGAGARLA